MSVLVGYQLIKASDGSIAQSWGGIVDQVPGVPNPIILPSGDHVHAPALHVDYGGYSLEEWRADSLPEIVPSNITRRQCALQLLTMGMITPNEAVEMVQAGIPPAIVAGYIATLPDDMSRAIATINFAAATYLRHDPLFIALMAANGKTDAEADAFFIAAAKL